VRPDFISPQDVRLDHILRREIALIDLREESRFALDHPLFAVSMPLGALELQVLDRIPNRRAKIVLYGETDQSAGVAAERLVELGYTQVSLLEGGLEGWRAAGLELFQDVNSASKAFGELVESRRHTPSIPAQEAHALIHSDADFVILDARPFEEFNTMSIPKAVNAPGAELVRRARQLAPDPNTTVIVNCAGRTRSIIGAQSLINSGLPNRVMALRNGTIGWTLAGLALDEGESRRPPETDPSSEQAANAAARAVAYRAGVREINPDQLEHLAADADRTLYRFDVRSAEDYAAGHIMGFRHAPGGQLVQETDVFVAIRGARIVLADDRGSRAHMSASWLAQMGWEVYVLIGGFDGPLEKGALSPTRPPLPAAEMIGAADLDTGLNAGALALFDLASSGEYRRGHIPGAWFAKRTDIVRAVRQAGASARVALTSPDGAAARLAAAELQTAIGAQPVVLCGGTDAWAQSGRSMETGETRIASPADDLYSRPYIGANVQPEAMRAYLDWEFGLVAQLERDGSHGFYVI
jgi:rhodanese-related sulfurtransferase